MSENISDRVIVTRLPVKAIRLAVLSDRLPLAGEQLVLLSVWRKLGGRVKVLDCC